MDTRRHAGMLVAALRYLLHYLLDYLLCAARSADLSQYAHAMRRPVLTLATCLRACYAMSGTDLAYGATRGYGSPRMSRAASCAICPFLGSRV
eukprot:3257962-Rhodomonas_salina.1